MAARKSGGLTMLVPARAPNAGISMWAAQCPETGCVLGCLRGIKFPPAIRTQKLSNQSRGISFPSPMTVWMACGLSYRGPPFVHNRLAHFQTSTEPGALWHSTSLAMLAMLAQ